MLTIQPLDSKSAEKKKDYIATVSFTTDDLPEITSWKIGGKYTLEIEVEQTGVRKNDYYDENPDKVTATFNIKKVYSEGETKEKKSESEPGEANEMYAMGGKLAGKKIINPKKKKISY